MACVLVLVAADAHHLPAAQDRVAAGYAWRALGPAAAELTIDSAEGSSLNRSLRERLADLPVDYCLTPDGAGRRKRLLLADMDSTIIGCECLDELADFAGVKDKVAAITDRAMRGELEFEG